MRALVGGVAASLAGTACLTAAGAAIFPFARRLEPCLRMGLAGCLLGATLPLFGIDFWTLILFHAVWQAGYAAAFATALPKTVGESYKMGGEG